MDNIAELQQLLEIPKDIVIISHRNPDGDAIGSSLGLYWFLKPMGHTVKVVFPSEYPSFVAWMPAAEKIIICDLDKEYAFESIKKADIIFNLDFNALDRIDPLGPEIAASKAYKVMIDHHLYPEGFPDWTLSKTSASSTCELIYEFMIMLGKQNMLTPQIADCLYTGLITDTGSFKYNITPRTMEVAGAILAGGANNDFIQETIFNNMAEKELRILGHCLYNRMEIYEDLETGVIWLTKDDFAEFDIQRGETEGIVNQILKIKKVQVAVFIKEQPTIIKLSMRSKGDFSVQEIATKYFKGGGHKNASGGHFYGSVDACKERFLRSVRNQMRVVK
jgi:phosphoesterase RecJ-like protein